MSYKRTVTGLLCIASLTTGCDSVSRVIQAEDMMAKQQKQISVLQQELTATKTELAAVKQRLEGVELDSMFRKFEAMAYLQPGDSGYSPIRFDLGVLTVQLADVKPYANGSKITLKFGNPLSTSINGLKCKIEWGRIGKDGGPDIQSAKSKEASFVKTLNSGAWTTVSVVLDSIPPTELGFVRLSNVSHTGISLAQGSGR